MTKGSKRRPGKGYEVNYDKIFKKPAGYGKPHMVYRMPQDFTKFLHPEQEKPNVGKPLTDRDRFYDGLPPAKIKDNTKQ